MKTKIVYILVIIFFLFSCDRKKTFDIEKTYGWDFIQTLTEIDKDQIIKNYHKQINILKNKDKFILLGHRYKRVSKIKIKTDELNSFIFKPLHDSSKNFTYYKVDNGVYYKKNYEYKDIKQMYYKFYRFNRKNYKFEYINKKIKVPHNGPGSMGVGYRSKTGHYIDDKYFWYCSFDTKQFHWWDFDNKYIDTFNMNVDNKFFYSTRTFLMLPKYERQDLIVTPNFVTGNFMKANQWWLKEPLLYKIDMYDSSYSKIDLNFKIKNEHNFIAAIDNGYTADETMILMGTEPIILFLNENYNIIKKLDLKNTYKKHKLEHLYEDFELTQPWGKVFNVSDKYVLILSPIFHFSDYNKVSIKGVKNSKEKLKKQKKITDTEEVGNREDAKKRVVILVNKKTKKVEKSEIVDLSVFYYDHYFCGPFIDTNFFVLKDMNYIIINVSLTKQLKRVEDFRDRKWKNYYYVYKRQKEK